MQGKKRKYSDRGNHGQTQSHQGQQANKKPKQRSSMTDLKCVEMNRQMGLERSKKNLHSKNNLTLNIHHHHLESKN